MNSKDILTKPIPQLLKDIAIPSSVGIIFNTLYNVVDTYYAGTLSTDAISGLSISFFLYYFIVSSGFGFSSALTALIGNAQGKEKYTLASIYAHKGVVFITAIGTVLMTIGFMFDRDLLILMNAHESYIELALKYIDTLLCASPFIFFASALNAILIAKGDTKTYRNALIVGFFANLILDPLLMQDFGLAGIAFATVIIQVFTAIYICAIVIKREFICSKNILMYLPKSSIYKEFLHQGMPPVLNSFIMSTGSIMIMYFVTSYGSDAVAGFGVAYRVDQIMLLPALGLSSAVLSIVSNNFGAKQFDRVKECIRLSLYFGLFVNVIAVILTFSIGRFVISLFDNTPNVIEYGLDYLYVEIFCLFGYVVLFVMVSTLQSIKQPKMIFYIALYRQLFAPIIIFSSIAWWFELPFIYLWFGLMFIVYSSAIFLYFYTTNKLNQKNI